MKVFELFNNGYNLEVRNSGNTLIYKKVDKKIEQPIINKEKIVVEETKIIEPINEESTVDAEEQLQEEALLAVQ